MKRRNRVLWTAVGLVVAACAAAATPAAAASGGTTGGDDPPSGPAAAATAYLQARATAVTAADPGAALADWLPRGSGLADTEALIARGAARRARQLRHAIESVDCDVEVLGVTTAADGASATVAAHAITTTTWRAVSGAVDEEASGIDHTVSLELSGGSWVVVADAYSDVLRPNYLEAAGAPAARVRRAGRALERASASVRLPSAGGVTRTAAGRRYRAIVKYDRAAAQAYADKYALSYNPTYVGFGADCANFASQCANAGKMPQKPGVWDTGWWYNKRGTSSPGDDAYSLSWINVTKQISFWNGRRTDWATSISRLARGDFVYYDWTGDGFWDHVAVVAGANSAGQKVIDAHSTNYRRVFWKLGTSSTRYRFAKARPEWVV